MSVRVTKPLVSGAVCHIFQHEIRKSRRLLAVFDGVVL